MAMFTIVSAHKRFEDVFHLVLFYALTTVRNGHAVIVDGYLYLTLICIEDRVAYQVAK